MFVLAIQTFGGEGIEADRVLSFLWLPHASSFSKRSYHQMEESLGRIVEEITKEKIIRSDNEEVMMELVSKNNKAKLSKKMELWKEGKYRVYIDVSYDIGVEETRIRNKLQQYEWTWIDNW